jgi:hypothetical protein
MGLHSKVDGIYGCQEVAHPHKKSSMMIIGACAECFLLALPVFNSAQQAKTASRMTFCSEKRELISNTVTHNYGFYGIMHYVADATLHLTLFHS